MQKAEEQFNFTTGVIGYPVVFVLAIWLVYWFEFRFGVNLNFLGVYPRTLSGLLGILFSPLIHGDLTHLWHNTLPLLILSAALFFFYAKNAWKVFVWGLLFTGILTWFIGRPANHIGASGIIYMLFGFLFLKGILAKHFRLIALSFMVVFIYGSMVWYVAPVDPKISWEGHLSGLIVGFFLAFVLKKDIAQPPKYLWESPEYNADDDEFLKHFDEDGNFIEKLPDDKEVTEDDNSIRIIYEYKDIASREEE